ncbi:MAG: hypothetical protein KAJ19_24170, partial [Gammaproteobacteria bacterium]|nr:hypothetical protein [Gammaproteobacteria bacterium]
MNLIKHHQRIVHSSRSLLGFTVCFLTFFLIQGSLYHLSAAGIYTIRVFESPELKSDRIRLGEIAEIKGEDPALLKKLRDIVIGKSPL